MEKDSSSPPKRLEARVYGFVQGVGYRYFVRYWARNLQLTGYARNDPEGTVTVVLEGPEEKLKEMVQYLKKGPPLSRVDDVQIQIGNFKGEFQGFEVR
ncbi:MAG: acylphosphatase [bacterium JZ-2024 1]